MCQMCETESENFGEILPDWFLCRANKDSDGSGIYHVSAGDWMLVKRNSGMASVVWTDEWEQECVKDFNDPCTYASTLIECDPSDGFDIITSSMRAGFKDENFNNWFIERLINFKASIPSSKNIQDVIKS